MKGLRSSNDLYHYKSHATQGQSAFKTVTHSARRNDPWKLHIGSRNRDNNSIEDMPSNVPSMNKGLGYEMLNKSLSKGKFGAMPNFNTIDIPAMSKSQLQLKKVSL